MNGETLCKVYLFLLFAYIHSLMIFHVTDKFCFVLRLKINILASQRCASTLTLMSEVKVIKRNCVQPNTGKFTA